MKNLRRYKIAIKKKSLDIKQAGIASLLAAAIASGAINYQKLLEKIFGVGGH